ncbi:venom acid phosphatase Acph-1-like [Oppia nitens]|uniref:venom acid phosphatase Acph-1-like n=1 Tax=Oppia nitens TaxID=1686743 RepID=UPI0023DA8351|nr:venom acid phosphatase Acph-1-like [Oppia nitens]
MTRYTKYRDQRKTLCYRNGWPNHDISTLKLLQIVHRHGDRAPTESYFPPNDPYKSIKYWPMGFNELTALGRYRMYSFGQFIRQEYHNYFGEQYSPREVYARSSLTDRCLESVSCLLAGAYPPKHFNWKWNDSTGSQQLSSVWQPITVETFMPRNKDYTLNSRHCPICDLELSRVLQSTGVQQFLKENNQFYRYLSDIVGTDIVTIADAHRLHDLLDIEISNDFYWSHIWSKTEQLSIVNRLRESHIMSYTIGWNSSVFKRFKAGGLIKELTANIMNVLNKLNDSKKLYVYSTHDINIIALLHALDIYDHNLPPFGASFLFELHRKSVIIGKAAKATNYDYFVRLFYFNDSFTGTPYHIKLTNLFYCYVYLLVDILMQFMADLV